MPGLDKKGPEGKGSKTGRGRGTCGSKTSNPENSNGQNNKRLDKNLRRRQSLSGKTGGQGNRFRVGQGT